MAIAHQVPKGLATRLISGSQQEEVDSGNICPLQGRRLQAASAGALSRGARGFPFIVLSRPLGREPVGALGAEIAAALEHLRQINVDFVQGFGVAPVEFLI